MQSQLPCVPHSRTLYTLRPSPTKTRHGVAPSYEPVAKQCTKTSFRNNIFQVTRVRTSLRRSRSAARSVNTSRSGVTGTRKMRKSHYAYAWTWSRCQRVCTGVFAHPLRLQVFKRNTKLRNADHLESLAFEYDGWYPSIYSSTITSRRMGKDDLRRHVSMEGIEGDNETFPKKTPISAQRSGQNNVAHLFTMLCRRLNLSLIFSSFRMNNR